MNGDRIKEIKARQVLDSKRGPVVETEIHTEDGKTGRAGASAGTSVGKNESCVLRDNDKELFGDFSAFEAVKNIEEIIGPALVSMDVTGRQVADHRMIELDGTRRETNLRGNVIYSVSCTATRATAASVGKPLWRYLAEEEPERVFAPTCNMINGNIYGNYTLAFQEFIVTLKNVSTFYEGPRTGVEVLQRMGDIIKKYNNGRLSMMGNYSGHGIPSDDPFILFDMLMEAASLLGYEDEIMFSMGCAAGEIYDEAGDAYLYKGAYIGRDKMTSPLSRIMHRHPTGFIEDALQEEDFKGFRKVRKEIQAVLIEDDFICSSIDRIKKVVNMGAVRGMVLEPNQIGTPTEVTETARLMKQHDLLVVASGRTGETINNPNAELAIVLGLPIMKMGAPRSEGRTMFANAELRVEGQLKPRKAMADVFKIPGLERLG